MPLVSGIPDTMLKPLLPPVFFVNLHYGNDDFETREPDRRRCYPDQETDAGRRF
jgi:hypothetical protein